MFRNNGVQVIVMRYYVIYDGQCNLCVTLTQLLESFDQGHLFHYLPMQSEAKLIDLQISAQECELGVILIDAQDPDQRWQGSAAIEHITTFLPFGDAFIAAYRAIPGLKLLGDSAYCQIRDNRYPWFGQRSTTYQSSYPAGCQPSNHKT